MAAVLCIGGAVKYKAKKGSRLNDTFILENVNPFTAGFFASKDCDGIWHSIVVGCV